MKKITSKKQLADKLSDGGMANLEEIGANIKRALALWASRKEVIIADNIVKGNF